MFWHSVVLFFFPSVRYFILNVLHLLHSFVNACAKLIVVCLLFTLLFNLCAVCLLCRSILLSLSFFCNIAQSRTLPEQAFKYIHTYFIVHTNCKNSSVSFIQSTNRLYLILLINFCILLHSSWILRKHKNS